MNKVLSLIAFTFIVTLSYGQGHQNLDSILSKQFSENSTQDGKWVYYPEDANAKLLKKPEVSKIIPEYTFFAVTLTNYLGWHINRSTCLILFDTTKSKAVLAVPMWYGDISKDLLKLFIGKKFSDNASLLKFVSELQDLMIVGSTGELENTNYSNNKVTFDMTNTTSRGKEVWRHIEIAIVDLTIKSFKSINPIMNESVLVQ